MGGPDIRRVVARCRVRFDSALEGDGFEPSVPRSPVSSLARPAAPACEGVGAVQRDFFCSACHSMEPIADVVWVGCGWPDI